MRRRRSGSWSNWAGNQRARPLRIETLRSELDVVAAVRNAARLGVGLRCVGAGHSFTDIAVTDGVQLSLDGLCDVALDTAAKQVRVGAGIRLRELNRRLAEVGLALPNLGDIVEQSVAGAISTGTHGTGLSFHGIASAVTSLRLVAADGDPIDCSETDNAELLGPARVSLGALGVISEVTLQCVDAFGLHAIEEPQPIDDVLDAFGDWVTGNDHAEFFWFPHTEVALTKRNNGTHADATPRPRWRRFLEDEVMENAVFGAITRIGRARPRWIPHLARRAAATMGRREYVARSDDVFATPRRVRFLEMEYAIPLEHLVEAFTRIRALIDTLDEPVSFPIEVRVLGGDDIPLSTAHGRDTAYLAVHVYRGMSHEQYFRGVERIADDYGGRPHWGKLHFQTADTLRDRYSCWEEFALARRRLDPDGRFANRYLDRVLGPVTG